MHELSYGSNTRKKRFSQLKYLPLLLAPWIFINNPLIAISWTLPILTLIYLNEPKQNIEPQTVTYTLKPIYHADTQRIKYMINKAKESK